MVSIVWLLILSALSCDIVSAEPNANALNLTFPNPRDLYLTVTEDIDISLFVDWTIRAPDVCTNFSVKLVIKMNSGPNELKESDTPHLQFYHLKRNAMFVVTVFIKTRLNPKGMRVVRNIWSPWYKGGQNGIFPEFVTYKAPVDATSENYLVIFTNEGKCALVVYDTNIGLPVEHYSIEATKACPGENPVIATSLEINVTGGNAEVRVPTMLFANFTYTPQMLAFGMVSKIENLLPPTEVFASLSYTTQKTAKLSLIVRPAASNPHLINSITVEILAQDILDTVVMTKNDTNPTSANTFTTEQLIKAQADLTQGIHFELTTDFELSKSYNLHIYTNTKVVFSNVEIIFPDYDPLNFEFAEQTAVSSNTISFHWGDPILKNPAPKTIELFAKAKDIPNLTTKTSIPVHLNRGQLVDLRAYEYFHTAIVVTYENNLRKVYETGLVKTLEAVPSQITKLNCQQRGQLGGLEFNCSWKRPEPMNGKLRFYILAVTSMSDFEVPIMTIGLETSISIVNPVMRFDTKYDISVSGVTISSGVHVTNYFSMSIKPYPKEAVSKITEHLLCPYSSSSNIDIKSERALFIHMSAVNQMLYSPISSIDVVVSETILTKGAPQQLHIYSQYISDDKIKQYGVNIYKDDGLYMNIRKDYNFTLGVDKAPVLPTDTFNGPLKNNADYSALVRICTRNGCTDSLPVDFRTNFPKMLEHSKLSSGAIAGIAIACIVMILLIGLLGLFIMRKNQRIRHERNILFGTAAIAQESVTTSEHNSVHLTPPVQSPFPQTFVNS